MLVAGGTTNACVAEELTGLTIDRGATPPESFAAGAVVSPLPIPVFPFNPAQGAPADIPWAQALEQLEPGDIFIKGGNALDLQGNVGILLGNPRGGTIGAALGALAARGVEIVAPVGLEKLVPSVPESARLLGIGRMDYSRGMPCGMQIVVGATVISEDKALALLSGCQVTVAAKGGVGNCTGSTTLAFSGRKAEFQKALSVLDAVLGEKEIDSATRPCPCSDPCDFGRQNSS